MFLLQRSDIISFLLKTKTIKTAFSDVGKQNGTTEKNNQQQSQQNQQKSPDQSTQNASTEDGGDKKYELMDETFEISGRVLHRIRALKNFGPIKKGDPPPVTSRFY